MCVANQAGLAGCVESSTAGITQVFHAVLLAWGQRFVLSLFLLPEDLCTAKSERKVYYKTTTNRGRSCQMEYWPAGTVYGPHLVTYHVVLLHIQPHICECLLYTWRCWFAVIWLTVHFNLPGSVPAVGVFFSHSCCLFKSSEWDLLLLRLNQGSAQIGQPN